MLIPIGTDVRPRTPPVANYVLIAANVLMFLFTDAFGGEYGQTVKRLYMLDAARPLLFQYVTYQFLHGDIMHLLGNMLFLWIFGHAVCERMGSVCYAMFYLGGGVSAGVVFAASADNPILGASGSIAAVTTAFLVLFPRVHITMLLIFIVITTFQLPAMVLIVFKIILWDNVIAMWLDAGRGGLTNVAHSAHLGGYTFGFTIAMLMLLLRALPRNQFDLLALWSRWRRRTGLAGAGSGGGWRTARPIDVEEMASRPLETLPLTPAERLREEILDRLNERDFDGAVARYENLLRLDPSQTLPRAQQLDIANHLAQIGRHADAAAAYEAFLAAYPASADTYQVRLLLGLICHRYLKRDERAVLHLRQALEGLTLESQRQLAQDELREAEQRLLGPSPDAG